VAETKRGTRRRLPAERVLSGQTKKGWLIVPLFHSWAEVVGACIQFALLVAAFFAKSAFEKLKGTLVANTINPKLVRNIENTLESARQNFSEALIVDRECFRYFQRICQNVLDLNRRNRGSYGVVIRLWWFKLRLWLADHSRNRGRKVLGVWHTFDVYIEGWKTAFTNREQVRRTENRYAQ